MACGSPGSDLCTRPSSASEASRAANCRHLRSKPSCCRRSRAAVRRSGRSISHSGLRGHSAQRPEPPLHPPPSTRSHLLFPEQPGGCHFPMVHECRPHGLDAPGGGCTACSLLAVPGSSSTPGPQLGRCSRSLGTNTQNPGTEGGRRPRSESTGWLPGTGFRLSQTPTRHGPAPAAQNPAPKRSLTGARRARRLGPGAPLRGPVLSPSALQPELHLPLQPRAGGGCGNRREWEWTGVRGGWWGDPGPVCRAPRGLSRRHH